MKYFQAINQAMMMIPRNAFTAYFFFTISVRTWKTYLFKKVNDNYWSECK